MEYKDYKIILYKGMFDYVNNGGSLLHITDAIKEYVFSYDEENLPHDHKESLENKAVQAMNKKQNLPPGIRLEKCIYHARKG